MTKTGFIHFDDTARVYEVLAADHEWLGCFDTHREARECLRKYEEEMVIAEAEVDAQIAKERRQLSGGR